MSEKKVNKVSKVNKVKKYKKESLKNLSSTFLHALYFEWVGKVPLMDYTFVLQDKNKPEFQVFKSWPIHENYKGSEREKLIEKLTMEQTIMIMKSIIYNGPFYRMSRNPGDNRIYFEGILHKYGITTIAQLKQLKVQIIYDAYFIEEVPEDVDHKVIMSKVNYVVLEDK